MLSAWPRSYTTETGRRPLAKKPNYDFEKRRKEQDRKKKKDAKREERLLRRRDESPGEAGEEDAVDGTVQSPQSDAPVE